MKELQPRYIYAQLANKCKRLIVHKANSNFMTNLTIITFTCIYLLLYDEPICVLKWDQTTRLLLVKEPYITVNFKHKTTL